MTSTAHASLIVDLARQAAGVAELLDSHKQANGDEINPYPFMHELAEWLAATFQAGNEDTARAVLQWLEIRHSRGPEEVRDLIEIGLVESLPSTGQPGGGLRKLLGPGLEEAFTHLNW